MRRTKEDAAKTRAHILDIALRLFGELGYSGASLSKIASAAKVTKGAIYWHFESKVDLYEQLIYEKSRQSFNELHGILSGPGRAADRLQQYLIRSFLLLAEDQSFRELQRVIIFKTEQLPELDAQIEQQKNSLRLLLDHLTEVIEEGKLDKSLKDNVQSADLAWEMLAFHNGVSNTWLLFPDSFPLEVKAEQIVKRFFESVVNHQN